MSPLLSLLLSLVLSDSPKVLPPTPSASWSCLRSRPSRLLFPPSAFPV